MGGCGCCLGIAWETGLLTGSHPSAGAPALILILDDRVRGCAVDEHDRGRCGDGTNTDSNPNQAESHATRKGLAAEESQALEEKMGLGEEKEEKTLPYPIMRQELQTRLELASRSATGQTVQLLFIAVPSWERLPVLEGIAPSECFSSVIELLDADAITPSSPGLTGTVIEIEVAGNAKRDTWQADNNGVWGKR
ncbi:hypothetical protein BKA70DRAFT_1498890 [Coprinopsis sp. MPI-PUGE-AT-0042]|nr:hypothetical protein BKA70DRAFT_1498890 [Coprinopsis sp. MPI-PUGE-AT-0042]